jgi:hypothetical protein
MIMYRQSNLKQWKDTAADALKQSGRFISGAGDTASRLANRTLAQTQRLYPKLVSSSRDARDKLYDYSAAARDGIYTGSAQLGYGVRRTASLGLWMGGLYMATKMFCSKESKLRQAKTAVAEHIRNEPVESALIALGIGYIIGRLR